MENSSRRDVGSFDGLVGRILPLGSQAKLNRWQLPSGGVESGPLFEPSGRWIPLASFADREVVREECRRRTTYRARHDSFTGNWIFQNLSELPLYAAGFLFVWRRFFPRSLGEALMDRNSRFQYVNLSGDKWIGMKRPAGPQIGSFETVADLDRFRLALAREAEATYGPIVEAFAASKLVSPPNAWATVLDSLHQGFLLAGRLFIGMDRAWSEWEQLLAVWSPPTRRRPRRVRFDHNGDKEELTVHAACCLVFTASGGFRASYCAACPVKMNDGERIARTAAWLDRVG